MPRNNHPPCPSVYKGQQCKLSAGPNNHRMLRTHSELGLPLPIHQSADGARWTAEGPVTVTFEPAIDED